MESKPAFICFHANTEHTGEPPPMNERNSNESPDAETLTTYRPHLPST
jgi:hypothetical protein